MLTTVATWLIPTAPVCAFSDWFWFNIAVAERYMQDRIADSGLVLATCCQRCQRIYAGVIPRVPSSNDALRYRCYYACLTLHLVPRIILQTPRYSWCYSLSALTDARPRLIPDVLIIPPYPVGCLTPATALPPLCRPTIILVHAFPLRRAFRNPYRYSSCGLVCSGCPIPPFDLQTPLAVQNTLDATAGSSGLSPFHLDVTTDLCITACGCYDDALVARTAAGLCSPCLPCGACFFAALYLQQLTLTGYPLLLTWPRYNRTT